MKNNPTTMIKCKFSNNINKIFNSLITEEEQKKSYYSKYYLRFNALHKMSDKDKLDMFNKIVEEYENTSKELSNYRADRIRKKKVKKARIARGYVPKKRTKKEEYLTSKSIA